MPSRTATVIAVDATHLMVRLSPRCEDCTTCRAHCARWFSERDDFRLPRAAAPDACIGDRLRVHAAEQDVRRIAMRQFGGLSLGLLAGAATGAALAPTLGIVTDGMSVAGALSGMVLVFAVLHVQRLRRVKTPTWLNIEVVGRPL